MNEKRKPYDFLQFIVHHSAFIIVFLGGPELLKMDELSQAPPRL
jgi:hypothetical protein